MLTLALVASLNQELRKSQKSRRPQSPTQRCLDLRYDRTKPYGSSPKWSSWQFSASGYSSLSEARSIALRVDRDLRCRQESQYGVRFSGANSWDSQFRQVFIGVN